MDTFPGASSPISAANSLASISAPAENPTQDIPAFLMPVMPIATTQSVQDHFGAQPWLGLGLILESEAHRNLNREVPRGHVEEENVDPEMTASVSQTPLRSDNGEEETPASTWGLFGGRDPEVSCLSSFFTKCYVYACAQSSPLSSASNADSPLVHIGLVGPTMEKDNDQGKGVDENTNSLDHDATRGFNDGHGNEGTGARFECARVLRSDVSCSRSRPFPRSCAGNMGLDISTFSCVPPRSLSPLEGFRFLTLS